jgi:predicted HicB family RNase H-like nuclease
MTQPNKPKPTKSKTNGDKTVGVNVNLPATVHRRLRVKAINADLSLTQAVTAAVEAWVKAS